MATSVYLKGLSYEIDFGNVDENWQILALTGATAGCWIFQRHLWFLVEKNIFFPVNAKMTPIAFVVRLFLYLYSRQAFLTEVVLFYKQPIRGSVGFVWANRSKALTNIRARENCNSLSDCYLHISKYHLAHRRPNTRLYGVCRTYANFFCLTLIWRRFRIIRCKRQAALHSALFNYTPLVIRGTSKNKQLTIIKPTQTGINRN